MEKEFHSQGRDDGLRKGEIIGMKRIRDDLDGILLQEEEESVMEEIGMIGKEKTRLRQNLQ